MEKNKVAISYQYKDEPIKILARLPSISAAESWIEAQKGIDSEGVERGDYGIDAPESMVNP